jgi:hypothetical protein
VTQRYTQNQKAYAQGNHSQHDQLTSNHRIFNHCFYINLALIFACKNQELKLHREDLHAKISKILFLKKWPSLKYASPFILEALLESTRMTNGQGEKLDGGHENRQMQHIARRVKGLMDSQALALKSAKVATYNRIARWMPY